MAEAQSEPVPSSSGEAPRAVEEAPQPPPEAAEAPEPESEPPAAKKPRLERSPERLEQRLGGILCCAVCLDLPPAAVYQCSNGHLMCAACFTHVLADARLRDEAATCPNCRVDISRTNACRNLAVEKTVSELPLECRFCAQVFPRHALKYHEQQTCDERRFTFSQIVVGGDGCSGATATAGVGADTWLQRLGAAWLRTAETALDALRCLGLGRSMPAAPPPPPPLPLPRLRKRPAAPACQPQRLTECEYACVGCPWRGPWHEAGPHGRSCPAPSRSAADALLALRRREQEAKATLTVYTHLLDLLSYEKITFNDLQLKPYRTEEFVHKLYYETSRFAAFGNQWVVKANVNRHQRDPTQSIQREITYQVILKSKVGSSSSGGGTGPTGGGGEACLSLQWVWVRGPFGEAALAPRVASHHFTDSATDTPPQPLPLQHPDDANRLLANKAIHFRLIMFLSSK